MIDASRGGGGPSSPPDPLTRLPPPRVRLLASASASPRLTADGRVLSRFLLSEFVKHAFVYDAALPVSRLALRRHGAVLPPGNIDAAIPDVAVAIAIRPMDRTFASKAL